MSLQSSFVSLQPFMLRQRKYCSDTTHLLFALKIVMIELRIVATVFFSFFFSKVAT